MHRPFIIIIIIILFLAAAATADNLYQVSVVSQNDADYLKAASVVPVARLQSGYLVLTDDATASLLADKGIKLNEIERDLSPEFLAVDGRLDDKNETAFRVIFAEDAFRLVHTGYEMTEAEMQSSFLLPTRSDGIRFIAPGPASVDKAARDLPADLQGLIDQVVQDSLESYVYALQAFNGRLTGTASNYASRDWIYDKFIEFGYDSVVHDSFVASIYGTPTDCQNVIAYKIGTVMPDHHIIIGGHRDAVSGSPGADDNGSGTAGVLECARILQGMETDLTFIFILFDAEEQGLHGSYHYANEAAARGDSIVYMLNMDMIAHYENSNQAKLYHGTETTYSELWQDIADSLVGISGVLSGSSGGSDHYPFAQQGYQVTFEFEYIFSTVYHSYQDSTSYMNFDYMTRMVKAGLATVYSVDQSYVPGPRVAFDYPDGYPVSVAPGATTAFEVMVTGLYDGIPLPNSGQLHYTIDGGPVQSEDMTALTANRYRATLPAVSCGDDLRYYVSAEETTNGVFYDPDPGTPRRAIVATETITAFEDDFESDKGWQVSGGLWQRGAPTGGGGAYGGPDPSSAYSGTNVYGYNLSGDYTNNMSEMHLTSPAIDCSDIFGTTLNFQRWLGVEQPLYDHAYVRISTNGTSWTTLWTNDAEVADYAWQDISFDISAIADGQPVVYLRFTMGVTDGAWTYCGWNVDDVIVAGYLCESSPDPLVIAGPPPPDGETGTAYSHQLTATGGTGTYHWSDKYGDLAGTGLGLSEGGLLAGTPTAADVCAFTAEVSDDGSETAEQLYSFSIVLSYLCGDANGDDGIDVADAVYIINYAFKGGPAPAPEAAGDANCDDDVNVADAVYLINHVFKGGPEPCCP